MAQLRFSRVAIIFIAITRSITSKNWDTTHGGHYIIFENRQLLLLRRRGSTRLNKLRDLLLHRTATTRCTSYEYVSGETPDLRFLMK
jgi:hypothetical protein